MNEENTQLLTQILEEMRFQRTMAPTSGAIDDAFARSLRRLGTSAEDTDEEIEALGLSTEKLNRVQIDQIKAAIEEKKARDAQAEAIKKGTESVKDLSKAILDTNRNFEKYSKGVEGITAAIGQFASSFGPAGKIIGATIEGLGKVATIYMQQADRLHKANDELAKFGTAGSFTIKELQNIANQAGITSKNMELLTKPIGSMGSSLIMLGKNTGDGVKAFGEMAKITNAQREGYQRLGVSQEQLLQTQADYVTLQALSGRNIRSEAKDKASLQKASLEYQDRLLELAALTGEDVESIKKKQQAEARSLEFQIGLMKLESAARRAEAAGRHEEAENLRKQAKDRNVALERVSALGNETVTKAYKQIISTGTIAGEEAQALATQGMLGPMQELAKAIKDGADVTEATNKFQTKYAQELPNFIDKVGFAISVAPELGKTLGVTVDGMVKANQQRDTDFQKETARKRAEIEEAKKAGKDPAQDARAKLTTLEIEAGKAMDSLVGSINPLVSGFNATSIAGTAAAGALTAAAAAAAAFAASSVAKAGANALSGAVGAAKGIAPIAAASGAKALGGVAVGTAATTASALLASAAVGYGVGTLLNKGIDSAIESITGKKGETLGGWLYDKIHGTGDTASKEEKPKLPKAAVGGIFEGPKSGYPVELHGKEMIIPLGTGNKIGEIAEPQEKDNRELEKQKENIKIMNNTVNDVNQSFIKMSSTILKLNKLEEQKLETLEDEMEEMNQFTKGFTNNLKSAGLDISKISKQLSFSTGSQIIPGRGSEFGSATGKGITPPSSPMTGVPGTGGISGTGIKPPTSDMAGYLQKVALVESGGKAGAKASTSSASGLFQFTEGTWKQMTKEMGKSYSLEDRFDPQKSTEVAAFFTQRQKNQLEKGTGQSANDVDMYMAHFLGAGGATKFLNAMRQNPNAPASVGADPAQIRANANIFMDKQGNLRTLQEVYDLMAKKLGRAETQLAQGKVSEDVKNIAMAKPKEIPQAEKGGAFEGPESGYIVELHGAETVIPTEKIPNVAKKSIRLFEEYDSSKLSENIGPTVGGFNEFTGYSAGPMYQDLKAIKQIASKIGAFDESTGMINDTDAWKSILHSGIATNFNLGTATVGTEQFGGEAGNILGDRLKEIMSEGNLNVADAVQKLSAEFKESMQILTQQMLQKTEQDVIGAPTNEQPMNQVVDILSNIAEKLGEGNNIQGKILQYSQV